MVSVPTSTTPTGGSSILKSAEEHMDLIAAYREVGTYRGAAAKCGTTHRTVKRAVEKRAAEILAAGKATAEPVEPAHNYDAVAGVVARRVESTKGRISAKRALPEARAAGYTGSARNFRRLVATAKKAWRAKHHAGRRPAVWSPGDTLVIDWGAEDGLHVFCAVAAWSRWRFVRFAADERAETTLQLLAECLDELGGVPKVVLSDRMACLKGAVVANVVVPTAEYVRFATHYGFRPDFCEGADPESKGIVENLVGYAKRDLVFPGDLAADDLPAASAAAKRWCVEVNGARHSETCAVPAERLVAEREIFSALPSLRIALGRATMRKVDRLACIRFGSARYSVPLNLIGHSLQVQVIDGRVRMIDNGEIVADHALVAPGEASVLDDHYGGPRPAPRRAVRAKTVAEKAFCALGPVAEAFIKGAAAAGATKLAGDLEELAGLRAAHGAEALVAALERAVAFSRWRASDVRSILAAGAGAPRPTTAGEALVLDLPVVPTRPLSDYAIGGA
jgi:transposase